MWDVIAWLDKQNQEFLAFLFTKGVQALCMCRHGQNSTEHTYVPTFPAYYMKEMGRLVGMCSCISYSQINVAELLMFAR